MKKLFAILVALTVILSACNSAPKKNDTKASDTVLSSSVAQDAQQAADVKQEPLLFEGESVYENWAYTFIDIDGNNKNDRVSFANIIKNDNESGITARLAIEFDFYDKSTDIPPVYIERNSNIGMHPEISCATIPNGALIFLKNSYAINGEELYLFQYTLGGALGEFYLKNSGQFPLNSLNNSSLLSPSSMRIEQFNDTTLKVTIGSSSDFFFTPVLSETEQLCPTYEFRLKPKSVKMSFDPQSKTIVYGANGSLNGIDIIHAYNHSIPVYLMITIYCGSGAFSVTDICLTSKL